MWPLGRMRSPFGVLRVLLVCMPWVLPTKCCALPSVGGVCCPRLPAVVPLWVGAPFSGRGGLRVIGGRARGRRWGPRCPVCVWFAVLGPLALPWGAALGRTGRGPPLGRGPRLGTGWAGRHWGASARVPRAVGWAFGAWGSLCWGGHWARAWGEGPSGIIRLIGTIQRKFAWPLRKDDAHKSRSVNSFFVATLFLAYSPPSPTTETLLSLAMVCGGCYTV